MFLIRLGTDGWYCATKGKMVFPLEGFCWSASFLFSKCISERVRVIKFCGYPLSLRCFWNSYSRFWKFYFEEFVLSNRRASPFIKPFLTPNGWQDVKCVYWKVSVGLKCVRMSRIDVLLNRLPLYTIVSRNVTSGVVIICLFNEVCYLFSSGTPEREDVVYISFPTDRLYCALF